MSEYEGYYYEPRRPKKKKSKGKFLAIGLTVVIASGSLGVGIGFGSAMYTQINSVSAANVTEVMPPLGISTGLFEPAEPVAVDVSAITASPLNTASEATVISVIREVSHSVVSINTSIVQRDFFNRPVSRPGAGSGIISDSDNEFIYIITNYHVIENAESVEISIDDFISVAAMPVGSDRESDIAVIRVSKADMAAAGISEYSVATFGDASLIEIGQTVIALGNAMGQGQSATLGIVSAKGRAIPTEFNTLVETIQTDAAINGGNSGGALVNLKGEVIGINTAKLQGLGVEGMGFAIPSNSVKEIFNEIMERSTVQRPFLGIAVGATIDEELRVQNNLPALGVFVAEVTRDSGAGAAGIRSGDIITSFAGVNVFTIEELSKLIPMQAVGTMVPVTVMRRDGNSYQELTLNVEVRDANTVRTF